MLFDLQGKNLNHHRRPNIVSKISIETDKISYQMIIFLAIIIQTTEKKIVPNLNSVVIFLVHFYFNKTDCILISFFSLLTIVILYGINELAIFSEII